MEYIWQAAWQLSGTDLAAAPFLGNGWPRRRSLTVGSYLRGGVALVTSKPAVAPSYHVILLNGGLAMLILATLWRT